LTETIAEPIRRYPEEYPKGCVAIFIDPITRVILLQSVGSQFIESRFDIIDFF
jgi:hypothetical protein